METINSCVPWLVNLWNIMCKYSRRHGNRTSISSLPNELIIDILNRLPTESVLACRAVCSSWHRLTNTTDFTQRHQNDPNRTTPVLLGRITNTFGSRWFYVDDLKLKPRFNRINVNGSDTIRSFCNNENTNKHSNPSCKGLLILRDRFKTNVIWNPMTREEITFNLRSEETICGFYFHVLENQFKLLIFQILNARSNDYIYSVYGLSTNDRKEITFSDYILLHYGQAVAACGALFWVLNTQKQYNGLTVDTLNILMFNSETESFVLKPQPTSKKKPHLNLLESEGKLWCCDIESKLVQVWILEDVRRWKWVKSYLVDLNGHINMNDFNSNLYNSNAKIIAMGIQNGNLLLYREYVGLFWCNLKRKTVVKINTGDIDMESSSFASVSATQYVASLVPLRENNILPTP